MIKRVMATSISLLVAANTLLCTAQLDLYADTNTVNTEELNILENLQPITISDADDITPSKDFPPTDDTYVDGSSTGSSYGTSTYLYTRNSGGGNYRAIYLKFDVTDYMHVETAESVKIRLFTYQWASGGVLYGPSKGTLAVHMLKDHTWTETTINASNASTFEAGMVANPGGELKFDNGPNVWCEIDITDYFNNPANFPDMAEKGKFISIRILGDGSTFDDPIIGNQGVGRYRFVSSNADTTVADSRNDKTGQTTETLQNVNTLHPHLRITAHRPAVALSAVTLNQENVTLYENAFTTQLTAKAVPINADDKAVVWSSSNTDVATVSSTGVVTPKGVGTATITATPRVSGATAGTCVVTVVPQPNVESVTIAPKTSSIAQGGTTTLTATILPAEVFDKAVVWKSLNPEIATVSPAGIVTGVSTGTATITATSKEGGLVDTCTVTVTEPIAVSAITLTTNKLTLRVGSSSERIGVTVEPADAANKTVTFVSDNPQVASVSSDGDVTPLSLGTAKITVTSVDKPSLSAICEVEVVNSIAVTNVRLDTEELIADDYGAKMTLKAEVLPGNATNQSVTWSSSNTNVATVTSTGVVTPKTAGTAIITVTTADGGHSATCKIIVNNIVKDNLFLVKKMATDDTYISGGNAAAVAGREVSMMLRGVDTATQARTVLLKTDLSEYADCEVVRARRVLTGRSKEGLLPVMSVRGMLNNNWDETTATYNNMNVATYPVSDVLSTVNYEQDEIEYSFDVTAFYSSMLDENMIASFKFTSNTDTRLTFYTKEGSLEKAPYIEMVLRPASASQKQDQSIEARAKVHPLVRDEALITALYNANGNLVDAAYTYQSAEDSNGGFIYSTLAAGSPSVSTGSDHYVKVYRWDSLQGMKPYHSPTTLNPGKEAPQSGSGMTGTETGQGFITISGNQVIIKGKAQPNEMVSLQLLKPGVTVATLSSISDLLHLYQVSADNNGNYSFKFGMPTNAEKSMYTLRTRAASDTESMQTVFTYPLADTAAMINEINSATTAIALSSVLLPYDSNLNIANSVLYKEKFEQLGKTGQDELFAALLTQKASITIDNVVAMFERYLAFRCMRYTTNHQLIRRILDLARTPLQISDETWNKYISLTDTSSVDKALTGADFSSTTSFNSAFLAAINAVRNTGSSFGGGGGGGGGGGSSYTALSGGNSGGGVSFLPATEIPETEANVHSETADTTVTALIFTDLDGYDWAKDSILKLVELGVVSRNTTFSPGANVTRAEFIKMLMEAFDLVNDQAQCTFDDVTQDAWYYKYVASAQQHGITNGNGANQFEASANITRQDMASLLYRVAEYVQMSLEQQHEAIDFNDAQEISDYAQSAVAQLQRAGIINGMDGGFAPLLNATRAQAAVIIQRITALRQ